MLQGGGCAVVQVYGYIATRVQSSFVKAGTHAIARTRYFKGAYNYVCTYTYNFGGKYHHSIVYARQISKESTTMIVRACIISKESTIPDPDGATAGAVCSAATLS